MRRPSPEVFRLACHVYQETPQALLIHDDASLRTTWIPRSQIVGEVQRQAGDMAVITMRRWLASQQGLL